MKLAPKFQPSPATEQPRQPQDPVLQALVDTQRNLVRLLWFALLLLGSMAGVKLWPE